jgi:hypothetical protein
MNFQTEFKKEYPIYQSNESTVSCLVKSDVKYRSRKNTLLAARHC